MTAPSLDGPYLELRRVSKSYGEVEALKDLSLSVAPGEFISILGPSGCGKTTALRVIAGLEPQDKGRVILNRTDVSALPVSKRNVGIVFQSYALFPNLTVGENIAYGLKGHYPKPAIRSQVKSLLELVGLPGRRDQFPAQLSGGQQQRVALARAMALSPDLLLLDEPLSALDAKVRVRLRKEIRELQQRLGVTTIMVTHDQEEALTMADRILVMEGGRPIQLGSPKEIYEHPATPFVAGFIGSMNFMDRARKVDQGVYAVHGRTFEVKRENGAGHLKAGDRAMLAIRPEDVMIDSPDRMGANGFPGRIDSMEYRGALFRLGISLTAPSLDQPRITADVPTEQIRRSRLDPEMPVTVSLPPERLLVYGDAAHV